MNAAGESPRGGSGAMFDRIARRYDALNRILSGGIDRGWRRRAVASLGLDRAGRLLDLATGTADLSIEAARARGGLEVVGLDPSPGMLAVGRRKVRAAGLAGRVRLVVGDAQALPFPDRSFDAVSIAFGIRNVPDRARALAEMARVLVPGGRLAILELSEARGGFLAPFARFHVHVLVPFLGALLSGAPEYRYLQQSIAAFPPPDAFAATIRAAGFRVEFRALTFGVCHLYVAVRGGEASP